MTADTECRHCYGLGRLHTRNGDPDDDGEPCPKCNGVGVAKETERTKK